MSVKSIIKNNRLIYKAALIIMTVAIKKYMLLLNEFYGIKSNKVVFTSFSGKSYSDNPRAISEKLHELSPEFEIVWLFNNPEEKKKIVPGYIRCVKTGSFRSIKELATAKFWVDNFAKPLSIYKSNKQIYIQTWHGDRAFKRILFDSPFVPNDYKLIESNMCDRIVTGSKFAEKMYKSAFRYNGEFLKIGSPRNDTLVRHNQKSINDIKSSLKINENDKIIMFAPTLRRNASETHKNQHVSDINLLEIISLLERKTSEEWICFVRAHSAVVGLEGIPYSNKIYDVTDYEDMADLLQISDLLITDYSSCATDFILTDRPTILFQSDIEEYVKFDRSFYYNMVDTQFLIAQNQSELIGIINNISEKDFIERNKFIRNYYGIYESGNAAQKVVEYIIDCVNV